VAAISLTLLMRPRDVLNGGWACCWRAGFLTGKIKIQIVVFNRIYQ
jgi:hypothetical protein